MAVSQPFDSYQKVDMLRVIQYAPAMEFIQSFMPSVHKFVCLTHTLADRTLKERGAISFSRFVLLKVASDSPDIAQTDVAQALGVSEGLISRQIASMIEGGLLSKSKDTKNRRKHKLLLTDRGKKELREALKILGTQFNPLEKLHSKKEQDIMLKSFANMIYQLEQTLAKK